MHIAIRRALVALLLLGPATAYAGPIAVGDTLTFADGPGTVGAGEFTVTVNGVDSFVTFCLQRTEYVDFSTTFTIDGISPYALSDAPAQGGDGAGRDWLSPQTAWLYTQFRAGTLAGYDYSGANRWKSANALQNAFWWFEGELPDNPGSEYIALANLAVVNGWTGIGNVRAMNLLTPRGVEAQDQLVLVDPAVVPEPTSIVLMGSGLAAMLWRRRVSRRRRDRPVPTA